MAEQQALVDRCRPGPRARSSPNAYLFDDGASQAGAERADPAVEAVRLQRDRLADFVRLLLVGNPRSTALDARLQAKALVLLDSLPVPERCPGAAPQDEGDGHAWFLPTEAGLRCWYCRSLKPDSPAPKNKETPPQCA